MSFGLTRDDHRRLDDKGRRIYTWREEEFLSVTSALNVIAKPALMYWAAKMVAIRAVDGYSLLGTIIAEDGSDGAVDWLKGAATRSRDRAATAGLNLHEFAEAYVAGEVTRDSVAERYMALSPDEKLKATRIIEFFDVVKPVVLESEAMVYNRAYGYAGTLDLILRIEHAGVLMRLGFFGQPSANLIVDIKTGSGVWPEAALQCSAYSRGEFIGDNDLEEERPLPSIDGGAVLHIGADSWALYWVDISEATFAGFLAARQLAGWQSRYEKGIVASAPALRGRPES